MVHRNNDTKRVINAVGTQHDPVSLLADKVQQVLDSDESPDSNWNVMRVQVQLSTIDPFEWLNVQKSNKKVYWKGRNELESIAGIGCADEITSSSTEIDYLKQFSERFSNAGTSRYFGGIRFNTSEKPSEEWTAFGSHSFFLPRFELVLNEDATYLVCNLVLPKDRRKKWTILKELSELKVPPHNVHRNTQLPLTRLDQPTERAWYQIIEDVLKRLNLNSSLAKVVIARKVTFRFNEQIDSLGLFKKLTKITPKHFHFYFQFGADSIFMGASPERLYKRDGRYVESEAIAGTGQRSTNGQDDSKYANALLSSEKDQREHAFVRDGILESMKSLCTKMQIDPKPTVLNLSMGRHLKSKFWGVLQDLRSDIDILKNLHPTSAVGGFPTQEAIDTIEEMEPFDRGWYAGPVGWIGQNSAEFSVAIRSALATQKTISLFSGAGIVKGSVPQKEWLEVEQKNCNLIKVLGLDQRSVKY
ncbi:MAG: isochorismate synthase [Rhodothermaceae bacterium]|nr:isochorismate synthase [Rhodothermaceae bacterium]